MNYVAGTLEQRRRASAQITKTHQRTRSLRAHQEKLRPLIIQAIALLETFDTRERLNDQHDALASEITDQWVLVSECATIGLQSVYFALDEDNDPRYGVMNEERGTVLLWLDLTATSSQYLSEPLLKDLIAQLSV